MADSKKVTYFLVDSQNHTGYSQDFGFVEAKSIVGKAKRVIVSFDSTDGYQPREERIVTP